MAYYPKFINYGKMKQNRLFELPPPVNKKGNTEKCKNCAHFQRWECGTKIIFYCGLLKSNRTDNGQLKIKANREACLSFKNE